MFMPMCAAVEPPSCRSVSHASLSASMPPTLPRSQLRPGKTFVFGGDLFDKGPADIRLARCLTDLKRRYPDRVFLIIGNRDHNKLRLTSELDTDDLARPVDSIPAPYWVGSRGVTFANYLRESQAAGDTRSLQELSTPTNKLRYMLRYTMVSRRRSWLAPCVLRRLHDATEADAVLALMASVTHGIPRHRAAQTRSSSADKSSRCSKAPVATFRCVVAVVVAPSPSCPTLCATGR